MFSRKKKMVAESNTNEGIYIQIYHVSEGYLQKIPVERRGYLTVLETGIFRK